jgi:hypothetical protein
MVSMRVIASKSKRLWKRRVNRVYFSIRQWRLEVAQLLKYRVERLITVFFELLLAKIL